jgi:hypothetical protein
VNYEKRAEVKISAVQDHTGKKTEFEKKPGARIQGDSVVGVRIANNVVLERSKIKELAISHTGAPSKVVTIDGEAYTAERIIELSTSHILFNARDIIAVPLANVDLIWIREVNVLATVLVDVVLPLAILGIAAALVAENYEILNINPSYVWPSY